ncbi:MAG: hypothetical protein KatS3mg068_0087 [Candidatus Sericytochromatia bacterium]|nr:MAG: hypothetical protein KatS3mg068_0087 [Candidatus Sericytochromatia bacterium]
MIKKIKVLGVFEPGFIPRGGAEIHVIELFTLLKNFVDFEIISVDSNYKELIQYLEKLEIDYFFDKKKIIYFYREIKITIFIVSSIEEGINNLNNFINKNKPDIFYSFFIRLLCYKVFINFDIPVIYFAYLGIIKPWTIGDNEVLNYILKQKYIYVSSKFMINYFDKTWNKNVLLFTEFINKENYLPKDYYEGEKYITFINPIKEKGLNIFLKIANIMKDKFFLVIGSWSIDDEYKKNVELLKKISNVIVYNPSCDMSKIYQKTKILLMPSIQEEGFGRVIIEACMNKIPVIASNRGAIPEILNNKGIIIDIDKNNLYDWINSINEVENNYSIFSEKAFENYLFYEKKLYNQIDEFKKLILSLTK